MWHSPELFLLREALQLQHNKEEIAFSTVVGCPADSSDTVFGFDTIFLNGWSDNKYLQSGLL